MNLCHRPGWSGATGQPPPRPSPNTHFPPPTATLKNKTWARDLRRFLIAESAPCGGGGGGGAAAEERRRGGGGGGRGRQ
eukprot:15330925-Alexandrium_andersonii.AAC.1